MVTARYRDGLPRVLALTGLLAAGVPVSAAPMAPGAPKVSRGVQDAGGQICGTDYQQSDIYRWEKGSWIPRPMDGMEDFHPRTMERGEDGAVWCVWQQGGWDDKKDFQLTRHLNNQTTRVARWKDPDCLSPFVLSQSSRGIWLTARSGAVFRIRDGGAQKMYVPKADQMPPPGPDTNTTSYETTQIAEDGEGRVLFWSGPTTWNDKVIGLRGILVYAAGAWKYVGQIPGAPNKPIAALVRHDAHHFWLAIRDSGLFELDSRTLMARRLPEPRPGAFHRVQDILKLDGSWHIFANSLETRFPNGDYALRESTLWRFKEDVGATAPLGTWEKVLSGLDYGTHWGLKAGRPVVTTPNGWWVSAMPGGVWWLPKSSPASPPGMAGAVLLDWRYGLTADEVQTLWLESSGRVASIDNLSKTWPDLRSMLKLKPEKRFRVFTTYGGLAQDSRHHIWRVPSLRERKLVEWDGYRWTGYDLPADYVSTELFYLSPDTRGHIWLMPDNRDRKVAILDPFKKSWRGFASMQAALEAERKSVGAKAMPGLKIGTGNYYHPSFSAGGRIAYRSAKERLHYFDGKNWRQWAPGQIAGKRLADEEESWYGRPFFDKRGLLCVVVDSDTYAWDSGKWQVEKDVDYPYPNPEDGNYVRPPEWAGIKEPQSTDEDREGTYWMVKERQVYKAAYGLCVPQFQSGERHPFTDGRIIDYVWIDPLGRPLFQTGDDWRYEFFFGDLKPGPETGVQVVRKSEDSFAATFRSNSKGLARYVWRLDGGTWSPQVQKPRLELDDMPAGTHTLEVKALNSDLRLDPTPARAVFRVTVTPRQQLDKQLARLRSPDYNLRETAVLALGKQPASMLPLLKRARLKASADVAWWIEAAIQEIERRTLGGERDIPEAPKTTGFRRERVEF